MPLFTAPKKLKYVDVSGRSVDIPDGQAWSALWLRVPADGNTAFFRIERQAGGRVVVELPDLDAQIEEKLEAERAKAREKEQSALAMADETGYQRGLSDGRKEAGASGAVESAEPAPSIPDNPLSAILG